MFNSTRLWLSAGAFALTALTSAASAQEYRMESVTVTSSKFSEGSPGVVLKRQGDFLLMDIAIESDSREISVRKKEIQETVDKLLKSAKQKDDITVSIDANGMVFPLLTSENLPMISGLRPDTSLVKLVLRTPIPKEVKDVQDLSSRLSVFANSINGVGRATVDAYDDTTVSVVNPQQYRMDVIFAVLDEVKAVTGRLGPDYRVVLTGIDNQMEWRGVDSTNVVFYIPYSYNIIPTSLTAQIDY